MTFGFTALRDRWLARPAVRARLGRLPIGRAIADGHARRLFGIVAGFAQSQMLAAAIELGVFDELRNGPIARAALDRVLSIDRRGFDSLVQALMAMGLIESRRGERVALTVDGLVVATAPGICAMIAHNRLLYADLADPAALLRTPGGGAVAAFWPYAQAAGDAPGYSVLMAQSQRMVTDELVASVDFGRCRHVMDVGGGDGSFVARLARGHPELRLTLVDLPDVLETARARLAAEGLGARVALVAAEAGRALPGGADAITLLRVLHDRDDVAAAALLRDVASALVPGGAAIVAEPVAHRAPDPQTAYFAAYFAAMGSGRLRTRWRIEALLRAAGLRPRRRTAGRSYLVDVIVAERR